MNRRRVGTAACAGTASTASSATVRGATTTTSASRPSTSAAPTRAKTRVAALTASTSEFHSLHCGPQEKNSCVCGLKQLKMPRLEAELKMPRIEAEISHGFAAEIKAVRFDNAHVFL